MCVAIVCETQHGICEASGCKLFVHLNATILAKGVGELESVELHVRVSVRQPLDHGGDCIFRTGVGRADLVTNIL